MAVSAFQNIFKIPELKRRIIQTFLLLAVYRLGTFVPVPGINLQAIKDFFARAGGGIFGLFSMFTGGAIDNGSIFALGIMPYISASIILQLLTVVWPYLDQLSKDELGRKKLVQYTRYGTVVLAFFQGFVIAYGLERGMLGANAVTHPGWSFRMFTAISLTAGTAFIMWLGEQISERGVGNGISLIIYAGIVARTPAAAINVFREVQQGTRQILFTLPLIAVMVVVVGLIVFVERAYRKIPVQHAKRVVGRRIYGGASTYIPLKVNTAGVIPPIFASSLLVFPSTISNFFQHPWVSAIAKALAPGHVLYSLLYVVLIIFFAYFYTAVIFNPVDVAENLKKVGAYIPGLRPGTKTADYIDRALSRITFAGGLYVAAVCVLPTILIQKFQVPFYFGGTALLIAIGVALDTIQQVEAHMLARHYDGFLGQRKFRGRRR